MKLMISPAWPSNEFRRTAKIEGGLSVLYVFSKGDPIDVDDGDLLQMQKDIGHALCVPKPGTAKVDSEATKKLAEAKTAEELELVVFELSLPPEPAAEPVQELPEDFRVEENAKAKPKKGKPAAKP